MGRAAKIAVVAVLAGLLATLALMAAASPPAPGAPAPRISGAGAPHMPAWTLDRCRTATVPDPECAAGWEAKRRHFFGQGKDAR